MYSSIKYGTDRYIGNYIDDKVIPDLKKGKTWKEAINASLIETSTIQDNLLYDRTPLSTNGSRKSFSGFQSIV